MSRFQQRPLWTPHVGNSYVGVTLDKDFAEACMKAIAPTDPHAFEKTVLARIVDQKSSNTRHGYLTLKDGLLVSGIYANSDGLWLTLDQETLGRQHCHPSYSSHNDDFASDRVWLMQAFEAWVDVAALTLTYR